MWVTQIGHIITRTRRHAKANPITAEEYLRNDVEEGYNAGADRFKECMDCYMKLEEMKRLDTVHYYPVMTTTHVEPLLLLSNRRVRDTIEIKYPKTIP